MSLPAERPFHLAFPVDDLEAARRFYVDVLGCRTGRESDRWIDFDLGGHQVVAHLVDGGAGAVGTNAVDGESVPAFHFGLVLAMDEWRTLRDRLVASDADFVIEPTVRNAGKVGEQATMFVRDPSGNALEFKALADRGQLFAT